MPAKSKPLSNWELEKRIDKFLDSLPVSRPSPEPKTGPVEITSSDPIPVILIAAERAGKIDKVELTELIGIWQERLGKPENYYFKKVGLGLGGGETAWVVARKLPAPERRGE